MNPVYNDNVQVLFTTESGSKTMPHFCTLDCVHVDKDVHRDQLVF